MTVQIPKRANYEELQDGFSIDCSTRSGHAFLVVPLALFWTGTAMMTWLDQIDTDGFSVRSIVFPLLFTAPGILLISVAFMTVFGEVRLELRDGTLTYFSGVAPIGRRLSIDWSSIIVVKEGIDSWLRDGRPRHIIFLEGAQRHALGAWLSSSQRYFVIRVLTDQIGKRNA